MIIRKIRSVVVTVVLGLLFTLGQSVWAEAIEDHYAESGPFSTDSDSVSGFTIYYPTNMVGDHPIITWGNGTAAPTFIYSSFLNHLASWGFVVIASNSTATQSGRQLIDGIDYLIDQNSNSSSRFYAMLDVDHIGTTGHSQGGGGAINAATDPRVTCSAPMAPSPGSINQVDGPVFLVAGQLDAIVSSFLVRTTSYSPASGPTVFGIANGMSHTSFTGSAGNARGYVTAWFMYHLQGDDYAAQAFIGQCELCDKSRWRTQMKNFP